ncbi:unnamed protein product [Clavelina lepadiformis]|uniref:Uncharacterized protein n=1 Tax=Clavelina lepadiformis TaxID=159417 RepID=A0ABP0GV37_CLALP
MSGNDSMEKIITNTEEEEEFIDDADFTTSELTLVSNENLENNFDEASTSAVKATGSSSADNQVEESIDKVSGNNDSGETSHNNFGSEVDMAERISLVNNMRTIAIMMISCIVIVVVGIVLTLHFSLKAF